MAKVFVSGLINTETTVKVGGFPIEYFPIDYPFFGVHTSISGVAYNIAKALQTLGDEVVLASLLGRDMQADLIKHQLSKDGFGLSQIKEELNETPSSAVLYDSTGKRQIYCDLKDIQEKSYSCSDRIMNECDIVAACNINFNRSLLKKAVSLHKQIATDVHVLSDIEDAYNQDFMQAASILFLSDEKLPCEPKEFILRLYQRYHNDIIVLGRGSQGALMYVEKEARFYELPCVKTDHVVNTVGAGDALFSGFLHFTAQGMEPVEALWHAQVFASAKIETDGAACGFITEADVCQRRMKLTR